MSSNRSPEKKISQDSIHFPHELLMIDIGLDSPAIFMASPNISEVLEIHGKMTSSPPLPSANKSFTSSESWIKVK